MNDTDFDFAAYVETLKAAGHDLEQPFTYEAFNPIAMKNGIAPEHVALVRLMLNVAAIDAEREQERRAANPTQVRAELKSTLHHANKLQIALSSLSSSAQVAIQHALSAQRLASLSEHTSSHSEGNPEAPEDVHSLVMPELLIDESEALELLGRHASHMAELSNVLQVALRISGEGQRGRRKDESLETLMVAIFQIFENFVGEEFTLYFEGGHGISKAAQFCVEVVKIFDPNMPVSKIESAARHARETLVKVSSSEDIPQFTANYRKRSR